MYIQITYQGKYIDFRVLWGRYALFGYTVSGWLMPNLFAKDLNHSNQKFKIITNGWKRVRLHFYAKKMLFISAFDGGALFGVYDVISLQRSELADQSQTFAKDLSHPNLKFQEHH